MSDVLIKGMKMPTCCDDCFALDDHGDYPYCLISHDQRGYTFRTDIKTMPSCPLIKLPTPHGRLIDADEMLQFLVDTFGEEVKAGFAWKTISEHCITIIEAEGGT